MEVIESTPVLSDIIRGAFIEKNSQLKPGLSGIAEYWSAKFEVIYLDGR